MATVYLGRISGAGGFQRFVGIKRLHPHLAREPEFVQMFLDEARLAARIHHPNVVPILEIGTSEQGYYIVMEYVEGDTLAHLIASSVEMGQRLPVGVASRIVVDVLAGLHAAHELADDDGTPLGIVHRDVSPQNILIGVDGSARLTDFGVARATSTLSTTRTGQLKGKVAYMAPEQARGAKDIDRRADVFAAAVVLWEALEGRGLFKGDGEADTLNKVLNESIPPLERAPSVPLELEATIQRALDRDRTQRFATAAAFGDALERATVEAGDAATHKDVAAYLDATLGSEILERREAVRAFIARSEPTRPKSLSMPPPATVPPLPRLGARPLSPERTPSSGAGMGSGVVSPSAAVRRTASVPPPPLASAGGRSRVWPWVLVLAIAMLGGIASLMRWTGGRDTETPSRRSPIATQAHPELPIASSPPPAASPEAPPVAPDSVAPEAPAATLSAVRVGPQPPRGTVLPAAPSSTPTATSISTSTPTSTSTSVPVPDDISRNPYR
jgi:serine/threonine protein kinase